MDSRDTVRQFVSLLQASLPQGNLECALFFGSALFDPSPRDIDVFLLFGTFTEGHLPCIKEAVREFPTIDLHVQWRNQLYARTAIRFGNQGAYFQQILAHAETMHGTNPFDATSRPLSGTDRSDLENKVMEYFFRLDRMYMHATGKADELTYLKKYVVRICVDLLLLSDELPFSDFRMFTLTEAMEAVCKSGTTTHACDLLHKALAAPDWSDYPSLRSQLYDIFLVASTKSN